MRLIFTVLEKLPDGKYRIKVEGYSDGKEVTEHEYIDPSVIGDMLEVNPNIKVGDEIVLDGEYKIVTLISLNRQARILARADTDFNAYLKEARTSEKSDA